MNPGAQSLRVSVSVPCPRCSGEEPRRTNCPRCEGNGILLLRVEPKHAALPAAELLRIYGKREA